MDWQERKYWERLKIMQLIEGLIKIILKALEVFNL